MTKSDTDLMAEYGITSIANVIYIYKEHRYNKLAHARNYAALESERSGSEKIRKLPLGSRNAPSPK